MHCARSDGGHPPPAVVPCQRWGGAGGWHGWWRWRGSTCAVPDAWPTIQWRESRGVGLVGGGLPRGRLEGGRQAADGARTPARADLVSFVEHGNRFMDESDNHVMGVHCLGGKGRTGLSPLSPSIPLPSRPCPSHPDMFPPLMAQRWQARAPARPRHRQPWLVVGRAHCPGACGGGPAREQCREEARRSVKCLPASHRASARRASHAAARVGTLTLSLTLTISHSLSRSQECSCARG